MSDFRHKLINTKLGVIVLPRIDEETEMKVNVSDIDVRAESSTQLFPIGTALIRDDGVLRYTKNGGVAVTIGKLLQQAAAEGSDHDNDLAVAATAAVGATSITITNGDSTAITEDMYKDGYIFINNAAGEGARYKIKTHPAADTSASCVLTLVDAIEVECTTSSKAGLRKNLYDAVVVNPTTPTGVPVGVVIISSFTANYYGWIKTKGIVAGLTNGTLVLGEHAAGTQGSDQVAGSFMPLDNDGATNYVSVCTVMCVAADTEYSLLKIDLDPSW